MLDLEGGADVGGGKFGSGLDILVQGLADGLEILGVGNFDIDALLEGVNEVLHLPAHGVEVVDNVLGVGLRAGGSTLKCREKRGKVESRFITGSSSIGCGYL